MNIFNWKLILVLWVLVLVTSIAVVYSTYQSRELFDRSEKLNEQAYQLDVQWNQLLLEKSSLATYGRIEVAARKVLDMGQPRNADVVLVAGDIKKTQSVAKHSHEPNK